MSIYDDNGVTADDPWTLKEPRDEDTVAAMRREAVMDGAVRARARFTCDDCARRFVCVLVFDPYNVAGDCLWEK